MKNLLLLVFCLVTFLAYSQGRKKVIYLDTLGNTVGFMESISIRNTGRYTWNIDESDEKVRVIKWRPTSKQEFDSLRTRTYNRSLIQDKIGEKFSYADLVDINGVVYPANQLKGKVIVINFWFVGCGPCEIEMPELNKLVDRYSSNSEVVFISFVKSSKSKTLKFLEKKSFRYPVIVMSDDLIREFKISAYPTNYVIDKQGKYHHASSGIGVAAVDILKEKIQAALKN